MVSKNAILKWWHYYFAIKLFFCKVIDTKFKESLQGLINKMSISEILECIAYVAPNSSWCRITVYHNSYYLVSGADMTVKFKM